MSAISSGKLSAHYWIRLLHHCTTNEPPNKW